MHIPTQLDPFNLVSLSEDIDLQCQRIIARELPKAVDEKALYSLKVSLREQMVSLLTEMLNEWRNLAEEADEPSIFDEKWKIPTVHEMAYQLPYIYGHAPEEEATRKKWHIERVRWTIASWMQMWGQLFAYLPAADLTPSVPTTKSPPTSPEPLLIKVPKASEILAITRIWQMLRLLTLEYLAKKADLLIDLGKMSSRVTINDDIPDTLTQAREAFWGKRADAPLLLILAVRDVLLQQLNIKEKLREWPIRLPTPTLLLVAKEAGLPIPYPVETLGNLCFDLESTQFLGDSIEFSYLYPVFRVLTDTISTLKTIKPDSTVHSRAVSIIDEIIVQNFPHANRTQD